jgi:hypothetical protein
MDKPDSPYNKDGGISALLLAWMANFIRMLLNQPALKDAVKLVEEQARLVWRKYFGLELERLQLEIAALEERLIPSDARLSALMSKLKSLKASISSETLNGEAVTQYIPFPHWRPKDKSTVVLSLFTAVVVLTMGAANVYANIMGSGNGIFIDEPYLAVLFSALLPAGSLALKFITDAIESAQVRSLYTKALHVLTVLVLLAWTVLFALNFPGTAAHFTFDDLESSNALSIALTWNQVVADLLVGGVLFQVAANVYAKYTPSKDIPDYIETEAAIKEEETLNKRLREERNEKRGIKVALEASLQAFVNDMVALYKNMKRQFDDASPL